MTYHITGYVNMHNPFVASLHGRLPLWQIFWLYGVIPSNLLIAVILLLVKNAAVAFVIDTLLIVLTLYTVWIVTAVWRCADNVQYAGYGVLARWLTVAWSINTLLFATFLILDLTF